MIKFSLCCYLIDLTTFQIAEKFCFGKAERLKSLFEFGLLERFVAERSWRFTSYQKYFVFTKKDFLKQDKQARKYCEQSMRLKRAEQAN
jgi:hypothetical protein